MIARTYRNGKLSLFKRSAVRGYDGTKIHIGDVCYDVFMDFPIGRIECFIIHYGYINALVNGLRYDIDSLYFDEKV
jgi:hypothetical protein